MKCTFQVIGKALEALKISKSAWTEDNGFFGNFEKKNSTQKTPNRGSLGKTQALLEKNSRITWPHWHLVTMTSSGTICQKSKENPTKFTVQ